MEDARGQENGSSPPLSPEALRTTPGIARPPLAPPSSQKNSRPESRSDAFAQFKKLKGAQMAAELRVYREAQRMGATTLARRNRSETDAAVEAVMEAREKSQTPVLRTCNRIHHELLHIADPSVKVNDWVEQNDSTRW